jgi:hypothetical protein
LPPSPLPHQWHIGADRTARRSIDVAASGGAAGLVEKAAFWRQWQRMLFEAGYAGQRNVIAERILRMPRS